MKTTTLLIILDGFGHRDSDTNNAIAAAETPNWDSFWAEHPKSLLSGSGLDVGLPAGQMGNSEVGHMTIGAGRVIDQDLTRINKSIEDGEFATNSVLTEILDKVRLQGSALHILGLLSPGGVHSHEDHILELIKLTSKKGLSKVYLHAFLDGRDTPPKSALKSLMKAESAFRKLGVGNIASVMGRYYAMDRDNRWDRIEQAYKLLVEGNSPYQALDSIKAVEMAYERGESDEFVRPTRIRQGDKAPVKIDNNDAIIFMNFRADRARQISRSIASEDFEEFDRKVSRRLLDFATLTRYADDLDVSTVFEPLNLTNTLGSYLADSGKSQLRLAETEKYAHVTFFFSGGDETTFKNEDRILVPSPKVSTYDQLPEMSAHALTDEVIKAINNQKYDLIVCNFANGDMVGHTGNFKAAVKAVETIDQCLGKIAKVLLKYQGQMVITADHGNVEQMLDPKEKQPHTAHTTQPVPLVYIGPQKIGLDIKGTLTSVAPTLLDLMHLPIPKEMTGTSLVEFGDE